MYHAAIREEGISLVSFSLQTTVYIPIRPQNTRETTTGQIHLSRFITIRRSKIPLKNDFFFEIENF